MPFDASYQAPPPVIPVMTPQESQAKALTLRNAIQQSQFAQQNQQQSLAEGQQRLDEGARRIAGEKALDSAMAAGITPGAKKADGTQGPATYNEDAITQHLIDSGMGHLIPGVKKQMTEMDEAAAKASKAKTEAATAQDDYAAQGLMTIHDNNWDPGHAVGTLAHMSANGLPRAEAADLIAQIVANPTPENVKAIIEPHITQSRAAQNLLDSRATAGAAQTTADARKKAADTGAERQANEAPGQIADATQKQVAALAPQLESAFAKGGLPAVQEMLDGQPHIVAKRFQNVTAAGGFDAAALNPDQKITTDQAALNARNTELDRKITQGQGAERLRLEAQAQFLRQRTFDVTMDNAKKQGLLGVPPHLIGPASAAFEKAGNEFATASAAADTMQSLLDLAEKGNKAAGSNVPLVGVETLNAINGIKRINGAEIAQYGSAGSLLDELKGKLGKLTVGQPISADVLKDIRELHTEIAKQAGSTYARKTQVTNQTYGSQFTPVQFGTPAPAAAPGVDPSQNPFRKK